MNSLILIALIIASYLLGNISVARILAKTKNFDITKSGSGNPGATNMLRKYGFGWGLLTLVLDAIKGIIPALSGYLIFGGADGGLIARIALYACGTAVIIGHIWPVFYGFKGGKGISTTLGVFAVADPVVMLIVFGVAFVYVIFFEYVSVASLLITTVLTILEVTKIPQDADPTLSLILRLLVLIIFVVTWYAHRANIHRLLVGKENKANLKKAIKKLKKQEKKEQKTIIKQEKLEQKTIEKQEKLEQKTIEKQEKLEHKINEKQEKLEKKRKKSAKKY